MPKKSRKQEFIYEIEKKILSGEWSIGEKIPTERELVEDFGVSRTVVNAALAELVQKGFLSVNPRQWTKVADYRIDGKLDVLYSIIKYNGENIDIKLLQGVLDARRVVEIESVKLAVKYRTEDDICQLEKLIKQEKMCDSIDEKSRLDFKFHHMICVASKNPVYPLIMNSFEPIGKKYLKIFYSLIDESYTINVEHIDIVNAIKDRDEQKAADALNALLLEGENVIKLYGGIKK